MDFNNMSNDNMQNNNNQNNIFQNNDFQNGMNNAQSGAYYGTGYGNNQNVQYNTYTDNNMYMEPANPNNGMAVASLVCGIVGIILCCCCGFGALLGIIGIILAILSKNKNAGKMSGLAIAGLICSILSVLLGISGLLYIVLYGGLDAMIDGFYEGYYGY